MSGPGELVRRAASGDASAWNHLVAQFSGLVWSVARAHRLSDAEAADVSQTTWLRLVEHLDRLHDPDRVGGWLATTARHECLRELRRAGRHIPTDDDELPQEGPPAPPLEAGLLVAERDAALWQAFSRIPPRCQTLLRLLVADPPPSYEEVGAALDMPVGSIGPTRARCLDHLRRRVAVTGINDESRGSLG